MSSRPARLVAVGLLLVLAGFVFALLFGWSVGHQPRLVAHDAYRPVFEQLAGDGSAAAWRELEKGISSHGITQRRAADVHGHSVNMGILLVLIGLFAPLVKGRAGNRVLLALAAAAIVYPTGLFLQFLGIGRFAEVISAIGAAGAVAALAILFFHISRSVDALPR